MPKAAKKTTKNLAVSSKDYCKSVFYKEHVSSISRSGILVYYWVVLFFRICLSYYARNRSRKNSSVTT